MDSVYVIRACIKELATDVCVEFNTKKSKLKHVAKFNEARSIAACTVNEGKTLVSGGFVSSCRSHCHF